MEITRIRLTDLEQNKGQVEGLPSNPRQWTKKDLEGLVESIRETPELLDARGLIVYPYNGKYIILGGNMRFSALREMNAKDAPCYIFPEDTPIEKLKEIVIKDNGSFGAWDYDMLANEWDDLALVDWGVDGVPSEGAKSATELLSTLEYDPLYYEPKRKPEIKLEDCFDLTKFHAKVAALDEYDLTEDQKEVLKVFCYRFIKIDFESIANYYAFNASEEEQKAIERLRLVLTDSGGVNGFIEDDLLRIMNISKDWEEDDDE